MGAYAEWTIVEYINLPFEWRWEICGIALVEQAIIGSVFIIKDLSGNIPNDTYKFSTMAVPEVNLKLAL